MSKDEKLHPETNSFGKSAVDVNVAQKVLHRDENAIHFKRRKIALEGFKDLHVVLDFDHTLTSSFTVGGERCHECHDIIHNIGVACANAGDDYDDEWATFREEIDRMWSDAEAGLHSGGLREWWERFNEIMVRHNFSRENLILAVDSANTIMRPGACELLDLLKRNNVRTTIVSAGIHDVIEECFKRRFGVDLHENVRIVANVPVWDKDILQGWKGPLIFSRNKAEVLNALGYCSKDDFMKLPKNIILAGNSVGDVDCLHGITHECNLTFGFLNKEATDDSSALALSKFQENYDLVECGKDADFGYLMQFLSMIENQSEH
uniref:5'-nucleotidase n=1 Tax=Proboscia inermis TaxID=420281 RepID=A0A7S0CAN0_9STRA